MTPHFFPIKQFLDKHVAFWRGLSKYAFSHITEMIPSSMLDPAHAPEEDGNGFWLPIPSTVDEKDLSELRQVWGHPVPPSFAYFLQQRHFLDLNLGSNARFFDNKPGELASSFEKQINTYYDQLPQRHYLPFATYSDWGVLCFDANVPLEEDEYPVVLFDHEDNYNQVEFFAINFLALIRALEKELDSTIEEINSTKQ